MYKTEGNYEFGRKEFNNAIHFYTEGIRVNCKDDDLNAKIYNNRATVHFHLGETSSTLSLPIELYQELLTSNYSFQLRLGGGGAGVT